MSKIINIKPPIWPKELTFEDFKKLNPLINENQIINLYNQYLNKFLTELAELKIHYKQSLNKNLQLELNNFQKNQDQTLLKCLQKQYINYRDCAAGASASSSSLNEEVIDNSVKATARITLKFLDYSNPTLTDLINTATASISNQTLILEDTSGSLIQFTTPQLSLNDPTEIDEEAIETWSEALVSTIINDPDAYGTFNATYGLIGDETSSITVISLTQNTAGSAGNTEMQGTLEESPHVTYEDFLGGSD